MLLKAGLADRSATNEDEEVLWHVAAVSEAEMLHAVDLAMLVRLVAGLDEGKIPLERNRLKPLLVGDPSDSDIDALLEEAKRRCRNNNDPD